MQRVIFTDLAVCRTSVIVILRGICFAWYHTLCGVYLFSAWGAKIQGARSLWRLNFALWRVICLVLYVAFASCHSFIVCLASSLLQNACPEIRWVGAACFVITLELQTHTSRRDLLSPEPSILFAYLSVLAQ